MVLCIKYRKKLLIDRERIELFKNVCIEVGERYHFDFDAIGTDGDHVHVFVGSEPKYAPSRVMQILKSITASQIFKAFPEIKKQLWGGEFWSDGGYIGTVGEGITAEIVRDYIERQGSSEEKESYTQMELFEFD
jgi:putative transposase